MPEVLLVNPRKRKSPSKRKRGPARARRRTTTVTVKANPSKPRRKRRKKAKTVRRRGYRRNPVNFNIMNFMQDTLMPSAVGAVGALGVDLTLGLLPLPDTLKTGPMRPLVKGLGAIGIGFVANMVATRQMAEQVTAGGLTVVLYDAMKTFMQTQFPALPLGEYDAYPALDYVSPAPLLDEEGGRYLTDVESDFGGDLDESLGAYAEPDFGGDLDESLGAYVESEY